MIKMSDKHRDANPNSVYDQEKQTGDALYQRPQLLAPAGSLEICRAVIQAGADAVYVGGSRFGARAYAKNFTQEELCQAIDEVHLYGKKLYLTVNTLLKQTEIHTLYDYLLPYYRQGLDAVIVQDFGVMRLVHSWFADLPVHISTQMSVASAYGFSYLQKLGVTRIVAARELSLEEIREIRSHSGLEIECFVHGALCYCYSGQCLLSSMLGGRSGNRGRCAQPCRLPYTILDRKKKVKAAACYPLSPKDLCTIDQLPQLIEAGISSFKIEGRMKTAAYAAGVTAVYRKYIDAYLEKGTAKVDRHDYERLLQAGNRSGFTNGYYTKQNGPDMITMKQSGHHEKSEPAEGSIVCEKKLQVQAAACLRAGEPARLAVSCNGYSVSAAYGLAEIAKKQPLSQEMIVTQLSKTGHTPFEMAQITVQMDDAVFLPKQMLNELRRMALAQLKEQILRQHYRTAPDLDPSNAFAAPQPQHLSGDSCFTAAVEEDAQLNAVLKQDFISRIYLDSSMYHPDRFTAQLKKHVERVHAAGKRAYLILPPIFRRKTARFYKEHWQNICESKTDGYLVKTVDELGFLEQMQVNKRHCILEHSLYTYSDETKQSYASLGWNYDTIPLELNKKELRARTNTTSELIIYGHLPLMTSAQCIQKTAGHCIGTNGLCYLKDRYAKEFPVRNVCSACYNTIYNPQPLSLIQLADELRQLRPAAYRLWFTTESEQMVQRICDCVRTSFIKRQPPDLAAVIGAYTNGHYKRGTE